MPPRKLTDAEKQVILALYRETPETTSTLAIRYNVSNSTISRLLKSRLPANEYELLVQQKRAAAGKGPYPVLEDETESLTETETDLELDSVEEETPSPQFLQLELADLHVDPTPAVGLSPVKPLPQLEPLAASEAYAPETEALPDWLDDELSDLEDEEEGDLDDEDDEDLDDEDLEDEGLGSEEMFSSGQFMLSRRGRSTELLKVLPLSEASLPKICYVVIDRMAELITRPLKDFGDLGQIPASEIGERTLPIFDNHRVARRFSRRTQRVIKVPDGRMFYKTGSYLVAKGITRLLIDGQVYSLQ